jgi:carbonic anhydrase/acetyltransferase-like protein (isoleucine patch superfamily)
MAIYEFEGHRPKIADSSFISDTAVVLGQVVIGENVFVGPGAVIRGDWGKIIVGNCANLQDNCVLHVRPDDQLIIGDNCRIAHGAVVHNCMLKDGVTVGINSVVSDFAEIGEWALLGEGTVVPMRTVIPARKIVVGVPGKIIGDVTEKHLEFLLYSNKIYTELAGRMLKSCKRID